MCDISRASLKIVPHGPLHLFFPFPCGSKGFQTGRATSCGLRREPEQDTRTAGVKDIFVVSCNDTGVGVFYFCFVWFSFFLYFYNM